MSAPSSNPEPTDILSLAKAHPNYIRSVSDFNFVKTIGKGGFGEVWLTTDSKTRKMCAVKEIYSERLAGKLLRRFLREVDTMAKIHDRFVVPFVGFSVETPYSIITEYLPNSSLDKYIYGPNRKNLSGTHLTTIAMGIAHGMANIHSLGILHRDLKSSNILMSEKMLPRICDFGISRIKPARGHMSKGLGTTPFIAPEVFVSNTYTKKVDVYSYAMLLYEMSEGVSPFNGMTALQITIAVTERGERPEFTKVTPSSLQKFISKCWDQDPEKRPNFSEIWESFSTGKVSFPRTDAQKISKLAKTIEDDDAKFRDAGEPTKPMVDLEAVYRRLGDRDAQSNSVSDEELEPKKVEQKTEIKAASESQESTSTSFESDEPRPPPKAAIENPQFRPINAPVVNQPQQNQQVEIQSAPKPEPQHDVSKILSDTKNKDFRTNFQYYASSLPPTEFQSLYQYVKYHFSQKVSEDDEEFIMSCCLQMMVRSPSFIQMFWDNGFFSIVPMSNSSVTSILIDCIYLLFTVIPQAIDMRISRLMRRIILTRPSESLILLSHYAKKYNPNFDLCILDFFASHAQLFAGESLAPQFISVYFFLLSFFPVFKEVRAAQVMGIFSELARSQSPITASYAIRAIAGTYSSKADIPYHSLLFHLPNPSIAPIVISLLLRIDQLPPSRSLAAALVERAKVDPKATLVLCRFADQSLAHAAILVRAPAWMSFDLPTADETLRLFLLIFAKPETREELSAAPQLANFLYKQIACSSKTFSMMPSIAKRIRITPTVFSSLESSGFIRAFFSQASSTDDHALINSAVVLLDILARAGFSRCFIDFIPSLLKVLSSAKELTSAVITVLLTLSYYPQTHQSMKDLKIDAYFESLKGVPAFSQYAALFEANMKK